MWKHIYNKKELSEELDSDAISPEEEAFMRGFLDEE